MRVVAVGHRMIGSTGLSTSHRERRRDRVQKPSPLRRVAIQKLATKWCCRNIVSGDLCGSVIAARSIWFQYLANHLLSVLFGELGIGECVGIQEHDWPFDHRHVLSFPVL